MIDFAEADSGLLQAEPDRLGGKTAVVFDPGEPLLLGEGDDLAVAHQRRRRVVYTGDAKYIHAIHSDSRKVCIRCII